MPSRFASRERTQCAIKNRESRRLARPRKRHYTFARRYPDQFAGVGVRHGAIANLKALICRGYLFVTKAKRQCRDPLGGGEADVFAPFVYRLGRHPFTVERAVRFR